jgi:hypothetical protein
VEATHCPTPDFIRTICVIGANLAKSTAFEGGLAEAGERDANSNVIAVRRRRPQPPQPQCRRLKLRVHPKGARSFSYLGLAVPTFAIPHFIAVKKSRQWPTFGLSETECSEPPLSVRPPACRGARRG